MFPRSHGTGCVLSSVLLLGSCIQETARGALCTGRSSAGAGSVILPGDCQTAAAEQGMRGKKENTCQTDFPVSDLLLILRCLVQHYEQWQLSTVPLLIKALFQNGQIRYESIYLVAVSRRTVNCWSFVGFWSVSFCCICNVQARC